MASKADIALVRSLYEKKGRQENGLFVVEGRKMVAEAARLGFELRAVYATVDAAEEFPGARVLSAAGFERMSRLRSPQGVLALADIPSYDLPEPAGAGGRQLILALDSVQDPGNLGTIVRTGNWFGVRDIVCSPDTVDCFNPKVVQATMGSLFRVRVHYTGLPGFLGSFAAAGVPVYGAAAGGGNVYKKEKLPPGVLVMGNEGNGISPGVARTLTVALAIPPYGEGRAAESLNVAVATAVLLSEFRRR